MNHAQSDVCSKCEADLTIVQPISTLALENESGKTCRAGIAELRPHLRRTPGAYA